MQFQIFALIVAMLATTIMAQGYHGSGTLTTGPYPTASGYYTSSPAVYPPVGTGAPLPSGTISHRVSPTGPSSTKTLAPFNNAASASQRGLGPAVFAIVVAGLALAFA